MRARQCLKKYGQRLDLEIAEEVRMPLATVRGRLVELRASGARAGTEAGGEVGGKYHQQYSEPSVVDSIPARRTNSSRPWRERVGAFCYLAESRTGPTRSASLLSTSNAQVFATGSTNREVPTTQNLQQAVHNTLAVKR